MNLPLPPPLQPPLPPAGTPRVTGTIVHVLYDDHVRQLKRQGAW
jgi:hypothetical protein